MNARARQRHEGWRAAAVALLAGLASACNPFRAEVPEVRDGIAAYDQSQFADADKKFDDALARDPSSEAHVGKGSALLQQHKYDDAAEQYRRALTTKDDALRARSYLDLGNTEAQAGQLDKAIDEYRRALQLDPTDPDARYNLEWALRTKQQQKQDKNGQKKDDQKKDDKKGGDKDEKKPGDDQQKSDQDQAKNDGKSGDQKAPDQPGQKDDGKSGDQKDDQQAKNDAQQKPGEEGQPKAGDEGKEDPAQNGQKPQESPEKPGADGNKPQEAKNGEPGDQGKEAHEEGGPAQRIQPAKAMGRQETAQVLDALQAGEKNLQMWRFQKKDEAGRTVDQDW